MRPNCTLFLVLAAFFLVMYALQTRFHPEPNIEFIVSVVVTFIVVVLLYGLFQVLRRLRRNKFLWRIIYALIILIVLLLLISVPELNALIGGWISGISAEGERPIVFAVLCLIFYGLCRSWPSRQSSPS
jgi:hypothetical protein